MTSSPGRIPDGRHSIECRLTVKDANSAIEFYKRAFEAREPGARITDPDGKVGHAELQIGDSWVMLHDEHPELDILAPTTLGGTPACFVLHIEDVDGCFERAVEAGAEVLIPVADQFYGHRSGRLRDPYGHVWVISAQTEDLTPEEIAERAEKFYADQ